MKFIVIQLSTVLLLIYSVRCDCEYFKYVNLTAIPVRGENFEVLINNCIEPQKFGRNAIKGLYSRNSYMPILGKNSIKNMYQLEAISFDSCFIEKLEPSAFNNVPLLSEIFLVNSNIREIPYGLFNNLPALEKIRIHNNSVEIIQDGAFSYIPKLKKIYAYNNKLECWNTRWFVNSTAIEMLDFQYNLLSKIPEYAFIYTPNLLKINFNYNNISVIERNAFGGLKHLKYLGLRYNRISYIDPSVFPHHLYVESLFIDANRLNYIPIKTLAKLTVKNITLDGNPWKCPCLESVGQWLRTINGFTKSSKYCKGTNVLQCIHLELFHYNCIETVDEELTDIYLDNAKFHATRKGYTKHCARLKY